MKYLVVYLLAVNLLLFGLMGVDKYKAKHDRWRVRESTLFVCAVIGGSVGGILGMRMFHHKTLHTAFRLGFPAVLAVQLLLAGIIWAHCA